MAKRYNAAEPGTKVDVVMKRQDCERRRVSAMSERSNFLGIWKDLAELIAPERARFLVTDRNRYKRPQRIVDPTATFAKDVLIAGMQSGFANPSRPWVRLTHADPDLAENAAVKLWLHHLTTRMLAKFAQSNLYNALPVVYGDGGVFGTGAMSLLEDDEDGMRCYAYPIGSYALGVSRRQIVDTFIRESQMTILQMIDEFGRDPRQGRYGPIDRSKFSPSVLSCWDRSDYDKTFPVCWIVAPNPDRDDQAFGSRYLPFYSCHYEMSGGEPKFLRESGFNEFPVLAPRWATTGEDTYGTSCPGMNTLPHIIALQTMQRRKAQAVEKKLNPPLQAPAEMMNQIISSLPGGITHNPNAQSKITSLFDIVQGIEELTADVVDTRGQINTGFYANLWLMLSSIDRPNRTATEIAELASEKLQILGPVTERHNDELFDPLVNRTFGMMMRAGEVPPPPPELEGSSLKIEYTSIMAQAMKLGGVSNLDRFTQSIIMLKQQFPEVAFKFRSMKVVDEFADVLSVNPNLVVPDDEAQQAMQQQQQFEAQQIQAQRDAMAAKAARDLSGATLDSDNALTRMTEQGAPA